MRIYKNDVVKVTVVSAEGKLLAPSVEDSGFTSLAGVISYVLNTKKGKGMQSTYRREKIVRTEKEFDINGTKVMAYSRKDAIKRLKHKK